LSSAGAGEERRDETEVGWSDLLSGGLCHSSLIGGSIVLQPPGLVQPLWIMVSPMDHTTLRVPFVLAIELNAIAFT